MLSGSELSKGWVEPIIYIGNYWNIYCKSLLSEPDHRTNQTIQWQPDSRAGPSFGGISQSNKVKTQGETGKPFRLPLTTYLLQMCHELFTVNMLFLPCLNYTSLKGFTNPLAGHGRLVWLAHFEVPDVLNYVLLSFPTIPNDSSTESSPWSHMYIYIKIGKQVTLQRHTNNCVTLFHLCLHVPMSKPSLNASKLQHFPANASLWM